MESRESSSPTAEAPKASSPEVSAAPPSSSASENACNSVVVDEHQASKVNCANAVLDAGGSSVERSIMFPTAKEEFPNGENDIVELRNEENIAQYINEQIVGRSLSFKGSFGRKQVMDALLQFHFQVK